MSTYRESRIVAHFPGVSADHVREHKLRELELAAYEAEHAYVCAHTDGAPDEEVDRLYRAYFEARYEYERALHEYERALRDA